MDIFIEEKRMEYSEVWERALAMLVDTIPITLIVLWFFWSMYDGKTLMAMGAESRTTENWLARAQFRAAVRDTSMLIWIVMSVLMDCSPLQGTLGKKLLNIKVVDENGAKISFRKSLKRNLFKIVSTFLSLGFIWAIFTDKKQTWHDMFAKTYVIERD